MSTSIDELLKLVDQELQKEDKKTLDKNINKSEESVKKFIDFYKIKAGNYKVANSIIYYYYHKFCDLHSNCKQQKRVQFFKEFNKLFRQVRRSNSRYYMLNESLNQSKDVYAKAEEYKKKYQKK